MKMLKRIIMCVVPGIILSTSVFANQLTSMKQSRNYPDISIRNEHMDGKYRSQYDEMKLELENALRMKRDLNSIQENEDGTNIYTKSFEEEGSIITLGIIYSEEKNNNGGIATYGVTEFITHAEVYIDTSYKKISGSGVTSEYKITGVKGGVTRLYDGAKLKNIEVSVMQGSMSDPSGTRRDNFTTRNLTYNKTYSWPYIKLADDGLLGQVFTHVAKYTLIRGTSEVSDSISHPN